MYIPIALNIVLQISILFNFLFHDVDISAIKPLIESNELKCNVFVNDIFDSKTHSTLMSGLPIHLVAHVRLLDKNNSQVSRNLTEIDIQYDIWDEMFFVKYSDHSEHYKSLDSVRNVLKMLKHISVASLSQLDAKEEYRIMIRIEAQNDKSRSIMDSIDHNPSGKGFGLTSIIRFFFGGSEPEHNWFYSDKFKLDEM